MMTPEERAHEAAGDWIMGPVDMGELERLIAAAIRAAVEADRNETQIKIGRAFWDGVKVAREQCAHEAETMPDFASPKDVAAAIRRGGEAQ